MRGKMWIYFVFVLLSAAWSQESGTTKSTSVNSNTSSYSTSSKIHVKRSSSFNVGSDAKLTCSDKTWNKMMYVIWNVHLKYKKCQISFSNDGQSINSCNDGKSLRNTSSAQSYLHIPNFSADDVGDYLCECVYRGGSESHNIHVAITVPPNISVWLERKDNKLVAVCRAERGNPAANISWSHTGNSSSVETRLNSDGFFTVESHLELHEGMNTENLSCAIRHPYWEQEMILVPKPEKAHFPWLYTLLIVVITVLLVGFLFFAQRKRIALRRCCRQPDISASKSPPIEDVEEVEPYASYVQRVNSIYN